MSGRKIRGLTSSELNEETFKDILKTIDSSAKLATYKQIAMDTSGGILANVYSSETRITGHRAYQLIYHKPDKNMYNCSVDVVIKSKVRGQEVLDMLTQLPEDLEMAQMWRKYCNQLGLNHMEWRELECMKLKIPEIESIRPRVYWLLIDESQDIFAFTMEYLNEVNFTHLNTADNLEAWKSSDILKVLEDISEMHAVYHNRTDTLPHSLTKWFDPVTKTSMLNILPIWRTLLTHNHKHSPHIWDETSYNFLDNALNNVEKIYSILDAWPKTLIHNDFKVANICLRKNESAGERETKRLCVYDWELCTLGSGLHDIAEFLIFALPEQTPVHTWQYYVMQYYNFFKDNLRKHCDGKSNTKNPDQIGSDLSKDDFLRVFDMCVLDLNINRLATYGLSYIKYKFSYLPRVISNGIQYLMSVKDKYSFLQT